MGGCRCTFRGCPNNSANSAGMHFFHYPFKKPERFKLWVKYADTKEFINLPDSQAKNKVVCETHFRDECFMNYKKERLVHFAIPTLVRLANGKVLDFETSDNPKPQHLEPPSGKHLIKPISVNQSVSTLLLSSSSSSSSSSSGCVEKYSSDNSLSIDEPFVIETVEEYNQPSSPPVKSPISVKRSYGSVSNDQKGSSIKEFKKIKMETKITSDNQPRILNALVGNKKIKQDVINLKPRKTLIASTTPTTPTTPTAPTTSIATRYEENSKDETIFSNDVINLAPVEENLDENQQIVNISFELPTDQDNNEILPLEIHEDEEDENNEFKESKEPEDDDKVNKTVLDQIVIGYEEQIKLLKEELEMKTAEVISAAALVNDAVEEKAKSTNTTTTTQVETVSTSRQPKPFSGSLTKAQLFNGIKKYLCPSMAALVRMEMFGGPDRQWKPDEKQVSVELLKLGGTVFNYFRDEWRFRLPPKKDVEQWLSECNNIEDEDEDI